MIQKYKVFGELDCRKLYSSAKLCLHHNFASRADYCRQLLAIIVINGVEAKTVLQLLKGIYLDQGKV